MRVPCKDNESTRACYLYLCNYENINALKLCIYIFINALGHLWIYKCTIWGHLWLNNIDGRAIKYINTYWEYYGLPKYINTYMLRIIIARWYNYLRITYGYNGFVLNNQRGHIWKERGKIVGSVFKKKITIFWAIFKKKLWNIAI